MAGLGMPTGRREAPFSQVSFLSFPVLKGTGFCYGASSPKPPENCAGPLEFFHRSRCTNGINDNMANLPLVSKTPVGYIGYNIRLLTPESQLEGKIDLYGNSITQRCPNK
jgi:hypothetical protein